MEIYKQKSWWKSILAFTGFIILLITLAYSNYLAKALADSEQENAMLFSQALTELVQNDDLNADFELPARIIDNFKIPFIAEDEMGGLFGRNWGDELDGDSDFLAKKKKQFLEDEKVPIEGFGDQRYIYFFNTKLSMYITYFPILQGVLLAFFIAFGYYLFSSSRKAEQNRVWAGMAKETAHQLGTPISAILAWIEHLKLNAEDNPEQLEIIGELTNDVGRLELIADRFSKIGSAPKLEQVNIYDQLDEARVYMQKRSPKKMVYSFAQADNPKYVMINKHLFSWVVENLIRNALDAMGREGTISTNIYLDNDYVCIEISDTGKGIPSSNVKTIFEPGFTTKKRGWGLGLSLAKRIIENYHQGKIYVKNSKLEEGTTFTIKLPKAS